MSYITHADIESRLGSTLYVQLADDDGDGVADSGVIDEVRRAAEAVVDSFLGRRYRTPIDASVSPELEDLLRTLALDVAEHRLRVRRPPVSADAVRLHEQTLSWLGRIADGTLALPALSALAGPSSAGRLASTSGAARRLTDDELEAF